MTVAAHTKEYVSRLWPKLHLCLGAIGFALAPVNVRFALEVASGFSNLAMIWCFEWPWVVFALGFLWKAKYVPSHRVPRLGLAIGAATWLSPISSVIIWRILTA